METYLRNLSIDFRTLEHPPVATVAAMMQHITSLPGYFVKNLLVKDSKKKNLFLIASRHDAVVSLNQLAKLVGAKELRFADQQTLQTALGVQPGAVTPLALINDSAAHKAVQFVVDRCLYGDGDGDRINVHPMVNDATVNLSVADFKRFLRATGHEPIIIDLPSS